LRGGAVAVFAASRRAASLTAAAAADAGADAAAAAAAIAADFRYSSAERVKITGDGAFFVGEIAAGTGASAAAAAAAVTHGSGPRMGWPRERCADMAAAR
jgi:hypothetical protein